MKVDLTQNECTSIKTALVSLAKAQNIGEADMGTLLVLSRKFDWREEPEEKWSTGSTTSTAFNSEKVKETTEKVKDGA